MMRFLPASFRPPLVRHLLRPRQREVRIILTLLGLLVCSLAQASSWPRSVHSDDGVTLQLTAPPERILSTSVTLTGILLPIGAPVVASAADANGAFFAQWAEVAHQRGVENLWPAGSIDLEAIYALQPDLILVSANGADSALEQIDELRAIAPTLVLNYGQRNWQTLTLVLADVLERREVADRLLESFDQRLADTRQQLVLPVGTANIISYNGPGITNPIAMDDGTHARLLASLGVDIEGANPHWHAGFDTPGDFVRTEYEYLTQLKSPTTFLLRRDQDDIAPFVDDPILANLPSIRSGQVYGLGSNSFRIDYYSALEIIEGMRENFSP
ncbi:Fe2+-enterobactin ABC transporter substrate-binding protein [Vreelandella olivaria]|uniref:Fe2+-enterobactin ABC transporter substrate-binding protein n=1 Tax=Vreelandella olivaria TaxID=390919 RepID=UPI00201EB215|nr:Fe2+-enterobactin ABC transporter substrate-binding protein [Halomonas olivaria]